MTKLAIFNALKISVTLIIVTFLVHRLDFRDLTNSINAAETGPVIQGLFSGLLAMFVSGLRWRLVSKLLRVTIPRRFAVLSYMESICFNLILPGSLAGDAIRVAKVTKVRGHLRRNLAAALFDRAANLGIILVLSVPACIFMWNKAGLESLIAVVALLSVCSLSAFLLLMFSGRLRRFRRYRLIREMVYFSMMTYRVINSGYGILGLIVLSLCVQGLQIAMLVCAARSVGVVDISILEFSIATFLALLAAALPFTVAGFGFREGALIWTLEAFDVDPVRASATAIVFATLLLLQAVPGLLIWLLGIAKLPYSDSEALKNDPAKQ